MDHPLLNLDAKLLRKRVVDFLKEGIKTRQKGNLVFVCGGNGPKHMRVKFREFCEVMKPDFEIFQPEFATKDYFSEDHVKPFDIASFETLIGELSRAIVVFPEAAGSFAESGYFAATEHLAEKTIFVMNAKYQNKDSFLSLGPQAKFDAHSQFKSTIQLNYKRPDFATIVERLNQRISGVRKRVLELGPADKMSSYALMCLAYAVVDLLFVATFADVKYIFAALFKNKFPNEKLKQLMSVLVGSKLLISVGEFGHYKAASASAEIFEPRDGFKHILSNLRLEILSILSTGPQEFRTFLVV